MLLSILYQLVRWLLGVIVVLVRRDLSKDAELLVLRHENAVLRRQITRVHYTPADRMWLTALVRAAAAPPLGRDLPSHSRHDPGLAPHTHLAQRGLHRTPPTRTSPDRSDDQAAHHLHGNRESHLGTPARAGRTGPPRPSHRRLHRVADPPATPASIPHRAGQAPPGASSSPHRPRPSWPWTSCTSTPWRCDGSTP